MSDAYQDFLERKRMKFQECGFDVPEEEMCSAMFGWQKDIIRWALKRGRAALFEGCGSGKTLQQLQWSKSVNENTQKPVLIVAPLAVAEQTKREGEKFGFSVTVVREQSDLSAGINVTNYEILDHFDANVFGGVVLDESSILKNYAGKIRNQIIEKFKDTLYKLSCTATPSPNDYMELGNQSEFLGVMTRAEMLATFFTHDGGETSKWRLKGHSKSAYWEWVSQWAVVLTKPSDLGYSDDGYYLPELIMHEHIIKPEISIIGDNFSLYPEEAKTLSERRNARKNSLYERCKRTAELQKRESGTWLVWCDLNAEQDELEKQFGDLAFSVRGQTPDKLKIEYERRWRNGERPVFISKPSVFAFGMNWQHCHNMVFVGLSDSYEMMYQAIRRCYRFGQENDVNVHIVISEEEGAVKANIERKEKQAAEMIAEMVKHTQEILKEEIRGTTRDVVEYDPQIEMIIPEWLAA